MVVVVLVWLWCGCWPERVKRGLRLGWVEAGAELCERFCLAVRAVLAGRCDVGGAS